MSAGHWAFAEARVLAGQSAYAGYSVPVGQSTYAEWSAYVERAVDAVCSGSGIVDAGVADSGGRTAWGKAQAEEGASVAIS